MPKTAKKTTAKKPAKPAKKKAAKKAVTKKTPATARPKTVTATPARVMSMRRGGKSVITAVMISSVTTESIAMHAYYIGERRRHLGLDGNPESDWLEAERQLRD
jgi:hypothetical protein